MLRGSLSPWGYDANNGGTGNKRGAREQGYKLSLRLEPSYLPSQVSFLLNPGHSSTKMDTSHKLDYNVMIITVDLAGPEPS